MRWIAHNCKADAIARKRAAPAIAKPSLNLCGKVEAQTSNFRPAIARSAAPTLDLVQGSGSVYA